MALTATYPSWLAEFAAASPETLGLVMLEADPHARRLDRAAQFAAVSDALADGAAAAKACGSAFPVSPRKRSRASLACRSRRPTTIPWSARSGGLPNTGRGRRALCSTAAGSPRSTRVVGALAARLLGQATPQDVFIAHELYHHTEAIRSDMPIARRHQPTLLRIGNWRWRTGIAALAEIAAGAFAQSLLDLPCHPKVLDLVAVDAISTDATAARIAARIAAASGLER